MGKAKTSNGYQDLVKATKKRKATLKAAGVKPVAGNGPILAEDPALGEEVRLGQPAFRYDPELADYSKAGQDRAAPMTPAKVLEELQAQLAEGNMLEEDVEELIKDPIKLLARKAGHQGAQDIVQAVASLYFQTLHKKATEGESFTEARVVGALREARARTLEAIADLVQKSQDLNQVLRVAELVSKD